LGHDRADALELTVRLIDGVSPEPLHG
jgi:hypothetical protein